MQNKWVNIAQKGVIENDSKENDEEQMKKISESQIFTKYTKHPFPPLLELEPMPIASQS